MKLYRFLLGFYPARFREEYAGPLEQQFMDDYRETQSTSARLKLWLSAARDLAWSIPVELAHELKQDFAHSLRVHARRPFIMTFTVAILALGIGGATGVFTVLNAVLIRSLPFRDPKQLVVLSGFNLPFPTSAEFHKWRASSSYLDDAAQVFTADVNVGGGSQPMRVTVAQTSFNFFSALGTEPSVGRAFAPSEDAPQNDAVAVIGYSLWQQRFGADPRVLGSKLLLNGVPWTVIGVAPPAFDYPHKSSVWTPTAFDLSRLPNKGAAWFPFGRLKKSVTFAQAETMFEAEVERISPRTSWAKDSGMFPMPRLIPLKTDLAENIREASLILMAAVGFVLLIACANVANLLVARITERRGELLIRAALGASRARLIQQLLSESVLLSFIATLAGLAIAYWAAKLASVVQPAAMASQQYTILDWRVFAFAIGIATLTGLLFGVMPAWLVRHLQPSGDLARLHASGQPTTKLRNSLIVFQVALTLILLSGSVTMGRGFLHILDTSMGFRADRLISLSISLEGTGTQSDTQKSEYYREALERLRAVPGVEAAAAAHNVPVDRMFGMGTIRLESGRESSPLLNNRITPGYFRAMGMQLIYGREFMAADRGVAILSEGIARQVADGPAVLGRKITPMGENEPLTIVGVVHPTRVVNQETDLQEQYFVPLLNSAPADATFVVRARGNANDLLAPCRDALQSVDREVPVYNVNTFEQRLNESLLGPRFRTTVFVFFGGFALLLAIAGIYGVSSYSITQRRREIGVRIAVGASTQGVRAMILRQALWPIGIGMIIGLGCSVWQGQILANLLSSAPPVDMKVSAAAAALLAAVAIASIWIATQRVLELNPIEVLKIE